MKKRNHLILSTILFLMFTNVHAITYYLSNNGDDTNNGLSPVFPWKTITKLNSMMLKVASGDAILFERGSHFTGQINIYKSGDINNPIIFGAYGKGKNPIISGAIPIKGWTVYKGKIFTAKVDTVLNNFFVNGQQMILARYPNSGYRTIKKPFSNPKQGFTDRELTQPKGYWNGSNVRMRTINWAFEYTPVKNFVNGAITFLNPILYPAITGWGYYLDNNLNILDTTGEWYFQKIQNSKGWAYYYAPQSLNPNNTFIEGSIYNFGFYSQSILSNIIIRDLEFRNQKEAGIYFIGKKSRIQIENCTFTGQILFGINFLNGSENCKVNNCRFYNINGIAMHSVRTRNSVISNNIFRNIGVIPGYGVTGSPFGMTAIGIFQSDSNKIVRNNITGAGHDGINCIGSANLIEKNVITNSMLLLNDGGAIKSYGKNSRNSIWRNNFIFNVPGNLEGASLENNRIEADGIYLDAFCNNMQVLDNTILHSGASGINLYNQTNNNLFNGNVCYDNEIGITFFRDVEPMIGNLTVNNIFFGKRPGQISVRLIAYAGTFIPGKFDSNYYCNPVNGDLFQLEISRRNAEYNFGIWKRLMGKVSDSHSKIITGSELKYSKLYKNMSDDTLKILLDPIYTIKDLNLNSIYGSIILQPWTSKILLPGINTNNLPEMDIAGGAIYFENVLSGNFSAPQWYNLIGNNISGAVTITAPDGFSISLQDDINFSKTISLETINGSFNKIIFVRFNPEEEKNYYDFIINSSGTLKSLVKVSGPSK